ncbi:MAG: copper amine oxidase N-terminal domain-containing protein, partial [Cellulosilyticaceae bacterium]
EVITVSYNGEQMQLEQQPQKIGESVLLPLRSVSQFLGYKVNWNAETKQIDIIEGGTTIRLVIDSDKAEVNGEEIKLNAPAQMVEGTTYVPVRFVAEALNIGVDWDSQTQSVNLESKYSLDEVNKQLLVRTKEGKKIISEVNTLNEYADDTYVAYHTTKNGSEIVSVGQLIQGAAGMGTTSTAFYMKDEKLVDKIEKSFHYTGDDGIIELDDFVILNDKSDLKFYDDKTGNLIQKYNLNDFQEGLKLDIMKIRPNYIMGRHERTIHIVDLVTGKVTRILDLIPEVDQAYVFQSDMHLYTDNIKLVWETDTALVFKYYSITEEIEKTVTCKLGQ